MLRILVTLLLFSLNLQAPIGAQSPGAVVRGRVVGMDGAPISGAQIRALVGGGDRACGDLKWGTGRNVLLTDFIRESPSSQWTEIRTISDQEGAFAVRSEIPDEQGPVLLAVAAGLAPRLVRADRRWNGAVTLSVGNRISMEVLTEEDSPVEGARIVVIPLAVCGPVLEAFADALVRRVATGEDGNATLDGIPDGIYAVRIEAEGRETTNILPIVVRQGLVELRARVAPGRTIRGRLEFPESSRIHKGTVVALWDPGDGEMNWAKAAFAGGQDRFVLSGLPRGATSVRIVAWTQGGLSSTRTLSPSELESSDDTGSIDLHPAPSRAWSGRLSNGAGAGPLLVQLQTGLAFPLPGDLDIRAVQVGPGGRFVVTGVPAVIASLRFAGADSSAAVVSLSNRVSGELGSITLPGGNTLEGRVTGREGRPLSDAVIEVCDSGKCFCTTRSNPDGRFLCSSEGLFPEDRSYIASVEGRGFRLERVGNEGPLNLVAGLRAPIVDIEAAGESSGNPAESVELEIERLAPKPAGKTPGREVFYAETSSGLLGFPIFALGSVRVRAGYPGVGFPGWTTLDSRGGSGDRRTRLPVFEGLKVSGGVVSEGTGLPIPGGQVELTPLGLVAPGPRISRIARTGGGGGWKFEHVAEGMYELVARASGWLKADRRLSVGRRMEGLEAIFLSLTAPGDVRGEVLGYAEGNVVRIQLLSRTRSGESEETSPDESGRYGFVSVRPGRYLVVLQSEAGEGISHRLQSIEVEVRPNEIAYADFSLREGVLVSGLVFLGKEVSPGAILGFDWISGKGEPGFSGAVADSKGHYSVVLPRAGEYSIKLMLESPPWQGKSFLNVYFSDKSPQEKDLHFSAGKIQGRLIGVQGNPVANAELWLFELRQDATRATVGAIPGGRLIMQGSKSSTDGSFELFPLAEGEYRLTVVPMDLSRKTLGPLALPADGTVDLGDIVVEPGRTLRLVVVGSHGELLEGATVCAFPGGDLSWPILPACATSGPDGQVVLTGLSSDVYSIWGLFAGLAPAVVEGIDAAEVGNQEPFHLQFIQGGALEIQVLARDGAPLAGVRPVLIDSAGRDVSPLYEDLAYFSKDPSSTGSDGRLRLCCIRPGQYEVGLRTSAKIVTQPVTVVEGQIAPARLIFTMPEETK